MGNTGFVITVIFLLWNVILTKGQVSVCNRVPIHTTTSKEKGDGGFSILVKGLPAEGRYLPGETYSGELLE